MEEKINKKLSTIMWIIIIWFIVIIAIQIYTEIRLERIWNHLVWVIINQWISNANWFDEVLDYLKYWI